MMSLAEWNEKKWSELSPEQKFGLVWHQCGPEGIELKQQVQFDNDRKWRWDYAVHGYQLAIEIDSCMAFNPRTKNYMPSKHQTPKGQSQDNEKRNAGVEAGWKVLVYSSRDVSSREKCEDVVHQVARVLYRIGEDQ